VTSGRSLALIPLAVAVLFGAFMLPRATVPETLPLPAVDVRAFDRVVEGDRALAAAAFAGTLAGELRALGTTIRDFHTLEAKDASSAELYEARRKMDVTFAALQAQGNSGLLKLRAAHIDEFIHAVDHFTRTGEETAELAAVGGSFVRRMRREGWCDGHKLALGERELRTFYKQMWSTLLGLHNAPEFKLTLDEQRVIYAFYLTHAHASEHLRATFAAARARAKSTEECAALNEGERMASDSWRLDKVTRLAAHDPAYPLHFARGVLEFHRGRFGEAAEAFRAHLQGHPSGPLSLRAQFHLRAALHAER
jgi:TolA-binding protein